MTIPEYQPVAAAACMAARSRGRARRCAPAGRELSWWVLAALALPATLVAASAWAPAGTATLLHDNGPIVTRAGAGAGGADASVVQTQMGNVSHGANHGQASGFRVADDFEVPAGGWIIDTITVYAYEVGSSTTSTIQSVNLRIWNGVPGEPGSSVVFGDTTTNRMLGSGFANVYRVAPTALTDPARPVMASVVALGGLQLSEGSYWLDWQSAGTSATDPWTPFVTLDDGPLKPGSNARLLDPGTQAWQRLRDAGSTKSQDLPFAIAGRAAGDRIFANGFDMAGSPR